MIFDSILGLPLVCLPPATIMFLGWLYFKKSQEAQIVDVCWTLSVASVPIFLALESSGDTWRRVILGVFFALWGARLGGHLFITRVLNSRGEDTRYRELRESWGDTAQAKFKIVFLWQGALAIILGIPFYVITSTHNPLPILPALAALIIWAIGFTGEKIADGQLERFLQDPDNKGEVCKVGLWRYSRHPNYFFEWLMWTSYPWLAWGSSLWLIALFPQALLLYFILCLTGIPPTEARSLKSKGDKFKQYQEETSAFFPLPPKL